MDRFNIGAELIERNLREGRAARPALWVNGKTTTYRELAQQVDMAACALLYSGVEPEQRVLLVMPDSAELVACYLAAMKIGAVAVPCNSLLRAADYAYFLEESRARVLVTARSVLERVGPALSQSRTLRPVGGAGAAGRRRLPRWLSQPPRRPDRAPEARSAAPAFCPSAAGAAGKPKAPAHARPGWPP